MCTPKEVKTIDQLIDEGPRAVKEIDDIVIGSIAVFYEHLLEHFNPTFSNFSI